MSHPASPLEQVTHPGAHTATAMSGVAIALTGLIQKLGRRSHSSIHAAISGRSTSSGTPPGSALWDKHPSDAPQLSYST
jgi:hypothetical protein